MSVAQESKEAEKQWDVKTITIPAVPYSFWGIRPALIPQFVQLYGREAIDDVKEGQEYLNLSFSKLKKLVAFLHKNGYDTANFSEAVEQAINDAVAEKNKKKGANNESEIRQKKETLPQKELYRQLQTKLVFFSAVNPKLRLQADGIWGPASQQVLDYVLQLYHLPPQKPSEALVEQLQAIASREVRVGCTEVSLAAAIRSNLFCILDNRDSKYKMEPKGSGAVLQRPFDAKPLIEFSRTGHDYLNGEQYNLFSAWLMLLNLKTEKPYDDFCDLWIREDEGVKWQSIEQPSLQKQREFVSYPDSLLSQNTRFNLALFVKFIPRTNFDIDIIAVYFSSRIQFRISCGEEIKETSEPGEQVFFPCPDFFEEPSDEQKALVNPLVNSDFIKLFVMRKNLVFSSDNKHIHTSDNITDHFYRLITAPPEALLATIAIGLQFEKTPIALEDFKKTVEKRYADNPITVQDDLQKARWGGQPHNNQLQLSATVTKAIIPGLYSIEATVHSTNPSHQPLTGHVAFFLHDTFPNEIEYVEAKEGIATLKIALCYEAFTLAAFAEDGTTLELDLNEVPGYPEGFYWKNHSVFQDRVNDLYEHKPATTKRDSQKGRWGGLPAMNGKTLTAEVDKSWLPGFYNVRLKINFSNAKESGEEAAFFLHKRLGRQIRFAPVRDGVAELKIRTNEAVTIGAYTEDGTELELDLNEVKGFPNGFYAKNTKGK